MIDKMMSPKYQYIKRSLRAVYNLITDHKKGRMFDFNEPWRYCGKPQIMNDEDVECFTKSVRKNPEEKNMKEYVNEMLIESVEEGSSLCI
jgi:hypothetical protein